MSTPTRVTTRTRPAQRQECAPRCHWCCRCRWNCAPNRSHWCYRRAGSITGLSHIKFRGGATRRRRKRPTVQSSTACSLCVRYKVRGQWWEGAAARTNIEVRDRPKLVSPARAVGKAVPQTRKAAAAVIVHARNHSAASLASTPHRRLRHPRQVRKDLQQFAHQSLTRANVQTSFPSRNPRDT
ncbi:hypothetical protein DFH06DRAFT_1194573 [Mycena polygramma]|nr:hypothetical protein DFH06DRAFT_1194573 [Mycena polygramma]